MTLNDCAQSGYGHATTWYAFDSGIHTFNYLSSSFIKKNPMAKYLSMSVCVSNFETGHIWMSER